MKGEGKIIENLYGKIAITSNNFRNFAYKLVNKGKNNKKNDNYEYYKSHHHQVLSQ